MIIDHRSIHSDFSLISSSANSTTSISRVFAGQQVLQQTVQHEMLKICNRSSMCFRSSSMDLCRTCKTYA